MSGGLTGDNLLLTTTGTPSSSALVRHTNGVLENLARTHDYISLWTRTLSEKIVSRVIINVPMHTVHIPFPQQQRGASKYYSTCDGPKALHVDGLHYFPF